MRPTAARVSLTAPAGYTSPTRRSSRWRRLRAAVELGGTIRGYRILSNTRQNCAGGATPWKTWLSCEEVTGYVYETDQRGGAATQRPAWAGSSTKRPRAIPSGRSFTSPRTRPDGCFYRFHRAPGATSRAGTLKVWSAAPPPPGTVTWARVPTRRFPNQTRTRSPARSGSAAVKAATMPTTPGSRSRRLHSAHARTQRAHPAALAGSARRSDRRRIPGRRRNRGWTGPVSREAAVDGRREPCERTQPGTRAEPDRGGGGTARRRQGACSHAGGATTARRHPGRFPRSRELAITESDRFGAASPNARQRPTSPPTTAPRREGSARRARAAHCHRRAAATDTERLWRSMNPSRNVQSSARETTRAAAWVSMQAMSEAASDETASFRRDWRKCQLLVTGDGGVSTIRSRIKASS